MHCTHAANNNLTHHNNHAPRICYLEIFDPIATVTRSEHYHIVPMDSTDLCHDYRNGPCSTLEQLVQTDLLFDGYNLTLNFLPGDHVLTEQLLIRNLSHVHITGQNESTPVVRFHSNGAIRFVSITELSIELGFRWITKLTSKFDR